ncbi:dihydrofolate reductase [candidate division KSB1 bacterium]|nr:dihydrofolate reductase [candidate division KSB1 bacterium]
MISLIVAIGKNNEIGKGNKLPWNLPADMKHFKKTTYLHAVIMGRKTFESIGRPLPDRRNIIITKNRKYKANGVEIVKSLEKAIALFQDINEEIFVIGGAEIYKQAIKYADKLYITYIDKKFPAADTFFPKIGSGWKEKSRQDFKADNKNLYNYSFLEYEK